MKIDELDPAVKKVDEQQQPLYLSLSRLCRYNKAWPCINSVIQFLSNSYYFLYFIYIVLFNPQPCLDTHNLILIECF